MSSRANQAGFSLIEVVLSLGVISFAFVGLLGLIPAGLTTLDTAIDATVESEILQHVATMSKQASYTALKNDQLDLNPWMDAQHPNRPAADYFFDEAGVPLTGSLATQQQNYIYAAAVVSVAGTPVPVGAAATGVSSYAQVATVRVIITKKAAPAKMWAYSLFVANNGLGQ